MDHESLDGSSSGRLFRRAIRSVSLLADSIDFLEDTALNLTCAFLLVRHRHHAGSLSKAAWLSARNDALANLAIIVAGILTAWTASIWPDLVVGLGIAAINVDAAREVWKAAAKAA